MTAQVGRFFDGGASGTAFATSTNGGASFTSGALPGLTNQAPIGGGSFDRTTDPVVAYDAKHGIWMISSLGLTDPGRLGAAVVVNRSADGKNWGNPDTVSAAPPGADYDKNWVACDNTATSPFYGNCYHTWDDFGDGDRILMSTSSDGGLTWSAPIKTEKRVYGLGGQPLVQPNGTVIIPAANAFETSIIAFRSTDGGTSWGDEVIVSHVREHGEPGNLRDGPLPSSEIGSNGRVYTVWNDCRFSKGCKTNAIVMATSDDGVAWSDARRVPIDDGGDQFIPGLGVKPDTTGQLGLTYYFYADPECGGKATDPCVLQVGYVQSNDGGATWSDPQTLAGPFPCDLDARHEPGPHGRRLHLDLVGRVGGLRGVRCGEAPNGIRLRPEHLCPEGRRERELVPESQDEGAVVLRQRRQARQHALGDPPRAQGEVRPGDPELSGSRSPPVRRS